MEVICPEGESFSNVHWRDWPDEMRSLSALAEESGVVWAGESPPEEVDGVVGRLQQRQPEERTARASRRHVFEGAIIQHGLRAYKYRVFLGGCCFFCFFSLLSNSLP